MKIESNHFQVPMDSQVDEGRDDQVAGAFRKAGGSAPHIKLQRPIVRLP